MNLTPGKTMFATGLVHQTIGALAGAGLLSTGSGPSRNLFAEIVRDGVVGAVEPDPQRQVLFWFLFFGFLLLMLGWVLDRLETPERPLPSAMGWQMLAIAFAGGLLIPVSGFWLAAPQGLWVLWRARKGRASLSASAPA